MPGHWAPWPGKTNTTRSAPSAAPSVTAGSGVPAATASSPRSRASRSVPRTTARWSNTARPVARVQPTSAGRRAGRVSRWVRRRAAWARRASRVRPCTGHTTGSAGSEAFGGASSGAGCSGAGRSVSSAGACSRMTWALVPDRPNADTAARRGRSTAGQSRGSVSRATAPVLQSTWPVGRSTCSVAGSRPCRSACTVLITPAAPGRAWEWPMLDFTEPSQSGSARSWP